MKYQKGDKKLRHSFAVFKTHCIIFDIFDPTSPKLLTVINLVCLPSKEINETIKYNHKLIMRQFGIQGRKVEG